MSQPLIFTENAARKTWELIEEEDNFNLKLRVYVTGGGCSGFQYGFTFDEVVNEDDAVIEKKLIAVTNLGFWLYAVLLQQDDHWNLILSFSALIDEESGGERKKNQAVQLLVDPMSLQYLVDSEIDYKEDLEGAQFIIRNPNAKTTCGCGSSFSA